jgi:hypothetical protein
MIWKEQVDTSNSRSGTLSPASSENVVGNFVGFLFSEPTLATLNLLADSPRRNQMETEAGSLRMRVRASFSLLGFVDRRMGMLLRFFVFYFSCVSHVLEKICALD